MEHKIKTMKEHYILCGFGRVGQQVAKELAAENKTFVVLDKDDNQLKLAKEHHWPYIAGDVALDETLFTQAGIEKAECIIIAVGTDADAVFMAVSARALNKDIFIVARASSQETADKLAKIGVNRIALPYQIGGFHMATMALRPTVVDFLDVLTDNAQSQLEMDELEIIDNSIYHSKSLDEAGLVKGNVVVVAVHKKNGNSQINPPDSFLLHSGDRLVVMGPKEQIEVIQKEFDKKQPEPKEEKEKEQKETKERVVVDGVKPNVFAKEEE